MVEQFWSGKRKLLALACILLLALAAHAQDPGAAPPQGPASVPLDPAQQASDTKVRALLASMVKAYGGDKWLNLPGYMLTGRTAAFYKNTPSGGVADFAIFHNYPDKDRTEFGKKHDVVSILDGNQGWEVTYKGKKPIPQKDLEDALRRRNHSIEIAMRQWLKQPDILLIDGGQTTVSRHLVDRVTLITSNNDNLTLELDAQTHLPVRRSFEWRDPLYKDKNVDADEYANYQNIDGIQTAFTLTRLHNDDVINLRYITNAVYGGAVPATMFDPDATASKLYKPGDKKGK